MGTFKVFQRLGRYNYLTLVLLAWWASSLVLVNGQNPDRGYMVGSNPYHRRVLLDQRGNYELVWRVDWDQNRIYFNVTVNTTGYVGFGLSRKGKMRGADLIIGGVRDNGQSYFADYYAIANQVPIRDPSQDWELLSASERRNQTRLSFTRLLDTCDQDHDIPISEDLINVIWSYSEVDDVNQYHFQNRGGVDIYLTDPELTPPNFENIREDHNNPNTNLSVIRLTRVTPIPPQDTFYSCTFHRLPTTTRKQIIGFNTHFPTEKDRQHVHHIILHRCKPPPGRGNVEFFDGPARSGGSECYVLDYPNVNPVPYCREVMHIWGVGGRAIFYPDHAGMTISTEPDEYVMFQVHFDNPNIERNLTVTVTLEAFYTTEFREFEVGVLQAGDMQPGPTTILIPPMSTNHVVMGHCAPGCTERFFGPRGGGYMFAAFLHTHLAGRGVRFMHLRGEQEYPWVIHDDNYNFNFQQLRLFKQERFIRPGDQVIHRCVYDNTDPWRNGTATHGGFSTREEMCTLFILYYSRNPGFALCRGEIRTEEYNMGLLGIGNFTWNQSIRQMVIQEPPEHRGKTIREYINTEIDWSLEFRQRLQREQITQPQETQCPRFFYEDPQEQIRRQLESGILQRTGRLPGSDGRGFTSVDEDYIHISQLPINARRWTEPPQCSRGGQGPPGPGTQRPGQNPGGQGTAQNPRQSQSGRNIGTGQNQDRRNVFSGVVNQQGRRLDDDDFVGPWLGRGLVRGQGSSLVGAGGPRWRGADGRSTSWDPDFEGRWGPGGRDLRGRWGTDG